jgi:hypothetical protein
MMYCFNQPVYDDDGALVGNEVVRMTTDEILEEYWEYWVKQMLEKFGADYDDLTTIACIEDWIIIYGAWGYNIEQI